MTWWPPLLVSGLLILVSIALLLQGLLAAKTEQVLGRLRKDSTVIVSDRIATEGLKKLLIRTGLNLSPGLMLCTLIVPVLLLLVFYILLGPIAVLIGGMLISLLIYALLQWLYQRRVKKIVSQMPTLLDHMVRSMKSGRSLEDAMVLAIARAPDPLHEALTGVRRSIELRIPLNEAVAGFASLYKLEEFHILAMGIQVNQQYGGNATGLLQSLITLIRDREKGRDQLRAMTGETRVSAWVLGILPLGILVFLFTLNPDFLLNLLNDVQGRTMLGVALALQIIGSYLIWRMLRSV